MASDAFKSLFGARPSAQDLYNEMQASKLYGASIMPETTISTPLTSESALREAIKMRMRNNVSFEFWQATYNRSKNEVVVFIIHKGTPMFVEDGYDLFPSDALVTKLRLMLG